MSEPQTGEKRPVVRSGTAEAADGALLHWRADGQGKTVLIASNGVGVSTFFWSRLARHFAPTHTFVTWDYRGHGQSPVSENIDSLTVALCARDLWTVADKLGAKQAVLIGHSMGCQVNFEAYRQHAGRVQALIPMLGVPGRAFDSFLGAKKLEPIFRLLIEVGSKNPGLAEQITRGFLKAPGMWEAVRALGVVHPDLCPREEFEPYFAHLATLDMRGWFALARDLLSHDATSLLPEIAVPTLVVAGERDLFTPLDRAREMAAAIPKAELLVLREGSHAAMVEQPELVALTVEKFLKSHGLF